MTVCSVECTPNISDLNGLLKELEASEKANGSPAAKPSVATHAYVKFKERMIESVSYREPLRVYNLAHLFGVVEDTMRLLGTFPQPI